ncbi:MAG: hypothetical protein SGJ18_16385 [Pseudomonadota bacterium]|nr:hypothetical protein [Pseudomonadota bacterium]
MKIKTAILVFSLSLSFNTLAAEKIDTMTAVLPKPSKIISYYGYVYRSFVGLSAGNSPVFLKEGDMQLHVLALRYNFTDKWAMRAGSAYLIHDLNFSMMNQPMEAHVEGFSDLRVSVVHGIYKNAGHSAEATLGLNLPTSPILKDEETGEALPPQDQISSGTTDLMTTLTYAFSPNSWTFAQKMDSVIRMGENSIGYRLGDEFGLTSSVSYAVKPYFVPSLSARYTDRKRLGVNHMSQPHKADKYTGSGWEGSVALRSGIPLGKIMIGAEVGAPFFRTSNTTQYTLGRTLWFASTSVTATF